MKQFTAVIFVCVFLFSCGKKKEFLPRHISKVEIQNILKDSLLNIRALEINEGRVVAASSKGDIYQSVLSYMDGFDKGRYFEGIEDSLANNNFRSLAFQGDYTYTLSIGSPAKLFQGGRLVYYENHPKAFYDSMDFWNDKEGLAIGDPTEDCMSIIITRDGGSTWKKLPCDILPKAVEGEAAFAASDSNIAIVGDQTWVATGGKVSRILYSPDKGHTWEVFDTPIVQGKETTGMYSIDFYDDLHGFAIGGDYTKPAENRANKIRTEDGGITWELVSDNKDLGYRSCVQYMPNRNAKELVAVGFKGVDYSCDSGNTWTHLSDAGFYTIRFLNDSISYAAGQGRISKLTFRE